MKLQQLRYLVEVAKQGLNVSEAAEKLHTSQPGISKQIRLLEDELGVQIFIRNGKRIVSITEPGNDVLQIAGRILHEASNLKRVSDDFSRKAEGSLTIATTHTQARYTLPTVITEFMTLHPKIGLSIKQGNPAQICEMVISEEADIAIATEGIVLYKELAMLPCYKWNRSVITPQGHPLSLLTRPLTLDDIVAHPIVTYDFAFAGRSKINKAFNDAHLTPNVVLTATDTDVIKTYVRLKLGIGIIASMAYEPQLDSDLCAIDASHLFQPSTTKIGIRKNSYLRGFVYSFIELFAPHLTHQEVDTRLANQD